MTIDRYIASVRRGGNETARSLTAYVEASVGYDTNVNVGPNRSSVLFPVFGITKLGPDSKANEDGFASLGAGANLRQPLGDGFALLAGVSVSSRGNFSKQQFDTYNGDVNLGVSRTVDQDVFTVMLQEGVFYVDDSRFRNHSGITGQWQRNLDARNQLSVFWQYTQLRYPDQDVRDADRRVGGVGYAHLFREGVVAYGSVYGLDEKPQERGDCVNRGGDWLGFSGWGGRIGGRMNLDARTVLYAGASFEQRKHKKEEVYVCRVSVDPDKRQDRQLGLTLGATHFFTPLWSVTSQLNLTQNKSNIALREYHRSLFSVTLRREF